MLSILRCFSIISLLIFLFLSCLPTDSDVTPDYESMNDTLMLVSNHTIPARKKPWLVTFAEVTGTVHIQSDAIVHFESSLIMNGGMLIVDSGATLKFQDSSGIITHNYAAISVRGTESKPVLFTSIDSTKTWGSIYKATAKITAGKVGIDIKYSEAASKIEHAIIENCENGVILNYPKTVDIHYTHFQNNEKAGLVLDNSNPTRVNINVTGNSFQNNTFADIITNFDILTALDTSNKINTIALLRDINVYEGTVYPCRYNVYGNLFTNNNYTPRSIVTIPTGASFYFNTSSNFVVRDNGQLHVEGTEDHPVLFTSLIDSSWGAGGNRYDGSKGGIWIDYSAADSNFFKHVVIENSDIGLYSEKSQGVRISHTTFQNNSVSGLGLGAETLLSLDSSTFTNNDRSDITCSMENATGISNTNSIEKPIVLKDPETASDTIVIPENRYTISHILSVWLKSKNRHIIFEEGVHIDFTDEGALFLDSNATIEATGSIQAPVTFQVNDSWYNIMGSILYLFPKASSSSTFKYCVFNDAKTVINVHDSTTVDITNCTFTNYTDSPIIGPFTGLGNTFESPFFQYPY